jgi:hypothetical protein
MALGGTRLAENCSKTCQRTSRSIFDCCDMRFLDVQLEFLDFSSNPTVNKPSKQALSKSKYRVLTKSGLNSVVVRLLAFFHSKTEMEKYRQNYHF